MYTVGLRGESFLKIEILLGKVKKCKGEEGKRIKVYLSPPKPADYTKTSKGADEVAPHLILK